MQRILILTFLIFISTYGIAGNTISGSISDCKTGKPLQGGSIKILKSNLGTSTNEIGAFLINNIPDGLQFLHVTFLGYRDTIFSLQFFSGEIKTLNICLQSKSKEIPTVVVTATRTESKLDEIPGMMALINKKDIDEMPFNNVDEILRSSPNFRVDRDKGVFSKNSSVTMRGLSGGYRVLTLIDGVPINKTDGGGINWNRINPESIERIEVTKGPGSALYGGNAMSGVINIISHQAEKALEGTLKTFYGTFNTTGGMAYLCGSQVKENEGFYWALNSFYRRGDGYILTADSIRDTTDVKNYLYEYTVSSKAGYQFNKNNKMELEYTYYDDKRGDGIKVYDPDGAFFKYTTNYLRFKYHGGNDITKVDINAFSQLEDYLNQKETLKRDTLPPFSIQKYSLSEMLSNRDEYGVWSSVSRKFFEAHQLTAGFDFKRGSVDASEIYFTSSDTVLNVGIMDSYGLFLQDEFRTFQNKIKIIGGLRYDAASFHNGSFFLKSPTSVTEFVKNYQGNLGNANWDAISPKLAIQYSIKDSVKIYVSYAHGFRPPILDDMTTNRSINKGIKLANPFLKPESVDNFEMGCHLDFMDKLKIEPAIYYTLGKDFQYFVGTGDTVFGGNKPKPVLRRENISKAEILGAEIGASYKPITDLIFTASYSYNHSIIKDFDTSRFVAKDLSGKYIMEVPQNIFYSSILWRNKYINTLVSFNYTGELWSDDENTVKTNAHYTLDIKFSRIFKDMIRVSLAVQNLTNEVYLDNKNLLGLPRFFMAEIAYKF